MTPLLWGLVGLILLLVLLLCNVKIGTAMSIVGLFGLSMILNPTAAITKLGTAPFDTISSYDYAVMPLFVLFANIIAKTGIGADLYTFFYRTIGRLRGGMAMASIVACAIFAAISSSTVATAVTIGLIALPEMKKLGYKEELATGSVAAGGTLGVMIPPSGYLITYGVITGTSISKLFMAGIIPGAILALAFVIVIRIICTIHPDWGPKGTAYTGKEIWEAARKCIDIVILIIFVLGGIMIGAFTATEAGALGCVGAVILTTIRKKMNLSTFIDAVKGTLKNTGMVYFMMLSAMVLNAFVSLTTITPTLTKIISAWSIDYRVVAIGIIAIYLFLGCFLNGTAMLLLTMPIFYPIMTGMGADPIWLGALAVLCMEMGALTPPVGLNCFVVAGLDKSVPLEKVFKGIIPFLLAQFVVAAIVILFPQVATWLPYLAK